MSGFVKTEKGYEQYFGGRKVTAHVKRQKMGRYYYERFYARVPVSYRRVKGSLAVVPEQVYGDTLDELEWNLKRLFRLDAFEPSTLRPGLLIKDYAVEWYEKTKNEWAASTRTGYWGCIKNVIIPGIGHIEVARLVGSDVDAFLYDIEEDSGTSAALRARTVCRGFMDSAVRDNLASRNIVNTKLKRIVGMKRPFLESDQIQPFLETAEQVTKYRNFYEFLMITGCRPAEGAGITWDRVNRSDLSVLVDRQYKNGAFTTTKTSKSREIWCVDEAALRDLLDRQWALQEEQKKAAGSLWHNPNGFVFSEDYGGAIPYWRLREGMVAIRESLGIQRLTMYSLRHTYATHTYSSIGNIEVVGANMGHDKRETTMIYVGTLREDKERYRAGVNGHWNACAHVENGVSDVS